jgi:methionyl-tRNA formyltransferase
MTTRIIFMGSPDFAVPTLEVLAVNYQVVGVVTQPDRPAGRGRKLTPPPVKILAEQLEIPVIQPHRLSEPESFTSLERWEPDLIVVAAFGQILKPDVLDMPEFGCINVHASLLPRWRGAAPIQAAILHGDEKTGITIMKMDEGLDTGPILSQRELLLTGEETAGSLSPELAQLGAELLADTLPEYLDGELIPTPQQGESSYARMLKKSDGELDFNRSGIELEAKIRAYQPWPGTYMTWDGQRLKIHAAHAAESETAAGVPGDRAIIDGFPAVITSEGLLVLDQLQPAGKKSMPGTVFLQGARNWI